MGNYCDFLDLFFCYVKCFMYGKNVSLCEMLLNKLLGFFFYFEKGIEKGIIL